VGLATAGRERLAGAFSIGAAALHGTLIQEHLTEWWGYGLFFLAAALAQVVLGLALLTDAINADESGANWRRLKRAMYVAGVIGNALLILMYVVTRTIGIPFLGPGAGRVEAVAPIDILDKALELAVIVILVTLWRDSRRAPAPTSAA
jgi:hypothetical protein